MRKAQFHRNSNNVHLNDLYARYFQNNECYFERISDFIKYARYTCIIISASIFKPHCYYTSYLLQVGIKILADVFEVLKHHFFFHHRLSMAWKQNLCVQMGHPFNTFLD